MANFGAQQWSRAVGVVLMLLGLVGLLVGDPILAGILNSDTVADLLHLLSGGVLAYAGFASPDESRNRRVVGGLGVIYLLVGLLGIFAPMLFGLIPHGYTIWDDLVHMLLGGGGIA